MERYLAQLIEDMREAISRVPKPRVPDNVFDADYMEELEESPEYPMSYWFGLLKEQFPPAELLSPDQIVRLTRELEYLWAAYGYEADFPDGVPEQQRYTMMRDYLDHKCQFWPGSWCCSFTFCNSEPASCPFGQTLCRCKNYLSEFSSEDDDQMFTDSDFTN